MKRHLPSLLLIALAGVFICQSCDDEDSYAKDRRREKRQIQNFLTTGTQKLDADGEDYLLDCPGPYKVISEEEFYANDSTTDVAANEYVLFAGSGVYMQIVRKGTGEKLKSGERENVICRFTGLNIATDSIEITNNLSTLIRDLDIMTVENYLGTFTASWISGSMRTWLSSPSVPNAWTIPFTFINLARYGEADDELAKVRLIIPSTEGHERQLNNTYPTFYEITYERGR